MKKNSPHKKNGFFISIARGIYKFFEYIYKILDKTIITPISKVMLFFSQLFKNTGRPFDRLLNNKLFLISFSLGLAITIFFLVDQKADLLISSSAKVLTDQELIAIYNKEAYVVEGLPETVDITLMGREANLYLAEKYPVGNITVDLSKCRVNKSCTVSVKYKNPVTSVNYKVDPSTITVKLYDKISEARTIAKEVLNEEKLDARYSLTSVKFSHDEVYIKSSKEKVSEVAIVKALLDVLQLDNIEAGTKNVTGVPLIAYNSQGEKLNVEIVPATVNVTLDIASPSKEVPILIVPEGNVAFGKSIDTITLSNAKVTIYGSEEALNEVSSIPVPIDVNNINSTTDLTVNLVKPSGIKTMSIKSVKVKITLGQTTEKTITGLNISTKNKGAGLTVDPISEADTIMDVIVKGTSRNIDALKEEDIKVTVDLTGLKAGVHIVKVEVTGVDNKLIYVTKRETITVRIK